MEYAIKGNELIIKIDVSDKAVNAAKDSKSGKSKVVATTNGFVSVGGFRLSLNLIK